MLFGTDKTLHDHILTASAAPGWGRFFCARNRQLRRPYCFSLITFPHLVLTMRDNGAGRGTGPGSRPMYSGNRADVERAVVA
jgi:hypothetical protein